MKQCRKCKQSKTKSEFHQDQRAKDGLQLWCKKCVSARRKIAWRIKHPIVQRRSLGQACRTVGGKKQKNCCHCRKWKVLNEFSLSRKQSDGRNRECRSCNNKRQREYKRAIKDKVFDAYGGYKCSCCNTTDKRVLSIDHINNDGYLWRKGTGLYQSGAGNNLYMWLRKENYPDGFQVLCHNCNWIKYLESIKNDSY